MNKKFAALLFALGVGVSASPLAFASCQGDCYQEYKRCKAYGGSETECRYWQEECNASCAG